MFFMNWGFGFAINSLFIRIRVLKSHIKIYFLGNYLNIADAESWDICTNCITNIKSFLSVGNLESNKFQLLAESLNELKTKQNYEEDIPALFSLFFEIATEGFAINFTSLF